MPHTPHETRTDVLFVSELALWPFDQGYRVHGPQMARALAERGLNVRMATIAPTVGETPGWLRDMLTPWPTTVSEADVAAFHAGWAGVMRPMRDKLASHQGFDIAQASGLLSLVREHQPRAVITLGQHGPMLLRGLKAAAPEVATVWYAADELAWFQLSCLTREPRSAWRPRFRMAAVYGLIERLFGGKTLDAVLGVSPRDARLLGWATGAKHAALIRNGVDINTFTPTDDPAEVGAKPARSAVFWGRMDFEPNVDAMRWFVQTVWPRVIRRWSDATLTIVGKHPTPEVKALGEQPGVTVTGGVPDIQPYAQSAGAVVLPMRCGGGIKNKLLEAAAMGCPTLCSPRAIDGLEKTLPKGSHALRVCRDAEAWVEALGRVWGDPAGREQLGAAARRWVEQQFTWARGARELAGLLETIERTDGKPCQSRVLEEPKMLERGDAPPQQVAA